jgi:hypothetical protein
MLNTGRRILDNLLKSKIARPKDEVSSRQWRDGLIVNLHSKEVEFPTHFFSSLIHFYKIIVEEVEGIDSCVA